MLIQLTFGTILIILTLLIQVAFIVVSSRVLNRLGPWLGYGRTSQKIFMVLGGLVIWLVMGLTVCCWTWALTFLQLDVLHTLESALYFAIVTFTTLGYGDITLDHNWRILASLCSVNGLIIVGLNTAFIVEVLSKIRHSQINKAETNTSTTDSISETRN
jgi:hypothetical protein